MILERLLDRLIDALTRPKRRDHTVLAILGGYLFIWTLYGVIAKSNQDLHVDMTELIAWSRDLAFGFPKHPPFAAILVRGWFAWFPIDDWAYYLLAILTATTALWIAWQLFADYLPPTKRVIALCLLTFIPFFNFHALKFNVNTVLMPLWAVTTFWFLRSYRTRSAAYAALAGVSAALCMVTKYWSIFLLVGLAVAAISDQRRRAYFRSSAPWITVLVGMAVISPHIGWLQKHNFSPMEYAVSVHGGQSYADAIWAALRYCADAIAYVSVPSAVVVLLARPKATTLLEMVWPSRSRPPIGCGRVLGRLVDPNRASGAVGHRNQCDLDHGIVDIAAVLLLSSHSVRISRVSVRRVVACAVLLPCAMLIVAPAVALVAFKRGLSPELTHTRMLADQVQLAWRTLTPEPLRYVGGNADLAYGVVTYSHDRPQALPGLPERPPVQLRSSGISLVCEATDDDCIVRSSRIAALNPAGRQPESNW